jgi:hypothetical protein
MKNARVIEVLALAAEFAATDDQFGAAVTLATRDTSKKVYDQAWALSSEAIDHFPSGNRICLGLLFEIEFLKSEAA